MSSAKPKESGIVNIRGKEYQTVARRVQTFRERHENWTIRTDLVSADDNAVVVKATILDESGRELSTGYAEEVRSASNINKTSAVENAETSAVGRALAFLGLGGTEIASADEVAGAISQQDATGLLQTHLDYIHAVREYWYAIDEVKEACRAYSISQDLGDDAVIDGANTWYDRVPKDIQVLLFKAPSKGGVFTTEERELLKTGFLRKAKYGESE